MKIEIKVYTTEICPNCKKVKEFLGAEGREYEEVDITTADALTELRINGVFTLITPVVQIGSDFLTHNDLFTGDDLRKEAIKEMIGNEEGKEQGI